jgi:hypothetical protein
MVYRQPYLAVDFFIKLRYQACRHRGILLFCLFLRKCGNRDAPFPVANDCSASRRSKERWPEHYKYETTEVKTFIFESLLLSAHRSQTMQLFRLVVALSVMQSTVITFAAHVQGGTIICQNKHDFHLTSIRYR